MRWRRGHPHARRNIRLLIIGEWRAWAQRIKHVRHGGLGGHCWLWDGLRRARRLLPGWRPDRSRRGGGRDRVWRRGSIEKTYRDIGGQQEQVAMPQRVFADAPAFEMEAVGAAEIENSPLASRHAQFGVLPRNLVVMEDDVIPGESSDTQ